MAVSAAVKLRPIAGATPWTTKYPSVTSRTSTRRGTRPSRIDPKLTSSQAATAENMPDPSHRRRSLIAPYAETKPAVEAHLSGNLDDPVRLRVRQRPKQRRVGHAEQRRGHAHRQRDGQNDDRREAGLTRDHPAGVANVLHHRFHDASSPDAISAVLHVRQVSEAIRRRASRFVGRQAAAAQLLFPHFQVELHLLPDLGRDAVTPERRAHDRDHMPKEPHGLNCRARSGQRSSGASSSPSRLRAARVPGRVSL